MRAKKLFNKTLLLGTTFTLVAIGAYVPISKAADDVNLVVSQYSDTYWETNDLVQYDFVDDNLKISEVSNTWTYILDEVNANIIDYNLNVRFEYTYKSYNWYLENGLYCRNSNNPVNNYATAYIQLSSTDNVDDYTFIDFAYTGCNPQTYYDSSTMSSTVTGNTFTFTTTAKMNTLVSVDGYVTYYSGNYNLNKVDINYTATEDNIAKSQPYYDSSNTYDELEQDIESSVVFDNGQNNLNTNIDVVFIDENGQEIPESEEPNKFLTSPYIDFYIKSDGTDSRITGQTETVNNLFIPYVELLDIQVIDQDGVNMFGSQINYNIDWNYDNSVSSYALMNNSDIYISLDTETSLSTDNSIITSVKITNPWKSDEFKYLSGGLDGEWFLFTSYDKVIENSWEYELFESPSNNSEKGFIIELTYDNNPNNTIKLTYYSKQQLSVSQDHILDYYDSSTGNQLSFFQGYLYNLDTNYVNSYSNIGITNIQLNNSQHSEATIYKYNSSTMEYDYYETITYGEQITLSSSGLYKIVAYDEAYGNEYVEYLDLYSNPTNQNIDIWYGTNQYNIKLQNALSVGYTEQQFQQASSYELNLF